MVRTGSWMEATIAKDGTESSEIELGAGEFHDVQVYNPALDSATITIKPSRKTGDTAVQAYAFGGAAMADFVNATTARDTAGMSVFKDICARFVTIVLSIAQAGGARTFYIRGIDPL